MPKTKKFEPQYEKPRGKLDGVCSAILEDGTKVPQYRVIRAKRCKSESMGDKCQGPLGHDGDHWCYSKSGWLQLWANTTIKLRKWEVPQDQESPPWK